ncbi:MULTISPECIES: NAD(+)--rifampin ADP-ribosyltransferase [Janibacter]|uniref:NAD(+)--rifampin ADP-ribosyltransferase n=1 Tax=Janibacter melonis TaxID=262209 RepID=A0A5P8FNS7_9MICO|nr:NAD(+)--rifampin ADP-ribosyltransferase [Janibacter melonis]MCM3556517.1 NAD(+)--rifampin ADP-ribosyltransferase [Janibacter melonis]QFQ30831.1 NAD(+)--rifampin ADP-ribosyltransferase [Janibacter melonis]
MTGERPLDEGPFFHGTRAPLRPGDHLVAGRPSNYRAGLTMRHVYITSLVDGAALAAELAVLLGPEGSEPHVYRVEPTGPYVDDPNVTDKKFPGNPTRSYRTSAPVLVVEEVTGWTRLTPEALDLWRERLAALSQAEIIN